MDKEWFESGIGEKVLGMSLGDKLSMSWHPSWDAKSFGHLEEGQLFLLVYIKKKQSYFICFLSRGI